MSFRTQAGETTEGEKSLSRVRKVMIQRFKNTPIGYRVRRRKNKHH